MTCGRARTSLLAVLAVGALVAGCSGANADQEALAVPANAIVESGTTANGDHARALFAGGCFWCMEPPFDELDGVLATTSGYTGGPEKNPSYQEVASGRTGHTEAVEVLYDPAKISFSDLLDVFWRNIDPLTKDAQFCDRGTQYRTGIFYWDPEQERLARESKSAIEDSGILEGEIVTEITSASVFYPAEDYHQDFYLKNPAHYKRYRTGCGRDRTLERIWGSAPH